ncbi:MAG TPA: glycoside hydrolase family 15 protein, partial [Armatimonadota bacterium]|nr:glycoside hydrolase family 15 protein [Armatimonadota bacterium]
MFVQDPAALIHYRHGYYYGLASDTQISQYQLGGNSLENAGQGSLQGSDTIGMMKEGSLAWRPETLEAGGTMGFSLRICFSRDLRGLKRLIRQALKSDSRSDLRNTEAYWLSYLKKTRQIETGRSEIDGLYKRSLLVFALMTNKRTGALLAAPEIDEGFTRCGRYAYCWGRDAAFITGALDKCGLPEQAEAFYRWAAAIQDENGSWQQRYYMDGNLAPSWGLQIDEGGAIIWGILRHYRTAGDLEFLREMWPAVNKGVEFLLSYTDSETGLPWLSFDLWEERLGEHAYSSAAVCAGIEAGAEIAEILGESRALTEKWRESASRLREAIVKNFWKPEWNRFVRSVRVKLNGWGEEHTDAKVLLRQNELGIARDYSLLDGIIDISLLGLTVPFGIYAPDDQRMRSTAEAVEKQLTVGKTGGLMRYEYDSYIGGNPWILTTLWAALYHIEIKSYDKAREYLEWAVGGATEQGLLPEQIGRETGRPAWVMPLTWSHAMFVLVIDGLAAAGE